MRFLYRLPFFHYVVVFDSRGGLFGLFVLFGSFGLSGLFGLFGLSGPSSRSAPDARSGAGQGGRPGNLHLLGVVLLCFAQPIAVAIAAATLWLMSGSLLGVLLPLVSCLTATLWVFGAMAALQIDINLITLVLGSPEFQRH